MRVKAKPLVSTAEPRTPPPTTTVFDDEDVTMAMAQTLIKMKEEKAKEKGVTFKDVEDSSRHVRSITTLQPLPKFDPDDKDELWMNQLDRKFLKWKLYESCGVHTLLWM
ncbi:hypothetical protein Tco_0188444, partial [Tanacetum coccineum]